MRQTTMGDKDNGHQVELLIGYVFHAAQCNVRVCPILSSHQSREVVPA